MNRDDWLQSELERHQEEWAGGHFTALPMAVLLCSENRIPQPVWLTAAVLDQLAVAFLADGKGKGVRGKSGNWSAAQRSRQVHAIRWSVARHWLSARKALPGYGLKPTREGAFEMAHRMLRGKKAQGTAQAIEASFDLVEASKGDERTAFLATLD